MIAASLNLALGNAGLMLMLASMTFGALSTAFSIRTGNTRTLRLAPRYAWLGLAGAVLAVVMMQRALITRDFSLAYVQQVGSTHDATALQRGRDVELARRIDPAVGDHPRRVHGGRRLALPTAHRRSPRRLGARRDVRRRRVLRARQLRPRVAVPERTAGCSRRSRSEPAAPEPRPRVVPPTDPVPGLRRVHGAVRVRDRGPDHGSCRRGVADGDQALGAVLVGAAHDRHPARRLVELRGARLERRVGVGSRRERQPPAVVDGDRVHPLGARAGAAGDAAGVEPQPARRHVRADDPRHVPHAVGRDQQRPRVRRRAGRRLPPRVLRARRGGVAGAHRVAW